MTAARAVFNPSARRGLLRGAGHRGERQLGDTDRVVDALAADLDEVLAALLG